MAAPRSRQDVAWMLRAASLPAPVDEAFVAVLADQARGAAAASSATPPRRVLRLAGAVAAVVVSTVGVALAANQGLLASPDPQRTPPATAPSDSSGPRPVDEDDRVAEQREDDHVGRLHEVEQTAPSEERGDASAPAEDTATTGTPAAERPAKSEGEATKGDPDGQDGPQGGDSSEEVPADEHDPDDGDTGDEGGGEDDGRDGDDPEESESPDPEESESPEPAEPDEPESDDGSDSAGATEPDRDSLAG